MLKFLFFCVNLILTESVSSPYFFSGYRNSFKAIPFNLSNTNIILSSPHAGSEMPNDIPDRTIGGCRQLESNSCTFHHNDSCSDGIRCPVVTVQDFASFDQFAELIVNELYRVYHIVPYAIIAKWNRKKIDFNREVNEATFNHQQAIKSYNRYHGYLRKAIQYIHKKYNGNGLLLDVHQHGQGNYTMVGIRLSAMQLNNDNLEPTSIESLINNSCPTDRNECIRGSKALGTFLESNGLGTSFPSLHNPKPMNNTFYRGGFITDHYSSKINVIQTELSYVVRNEFDPNVYAAKYVQALVHFMKANHLFM